MRFFSRIVKSPAVRPLVATAKVTMVSAEAQVRENYKALELVALAHELRRLDMHRGGRYPREPRALSPLPIRPAIPPDPEAPTPGLQGIEQQLFGLAPENFTNLPPEEREHCLTALACPDDSVVRAPPSLVKDPVR